MRHSIVKVFAFISYYLGIINLFYILNSKVKRIITFHNVIPYELLPYGKQIGLIDSEESFRFKIREIQKRFPISTDLANYKSVTITFDDGYLNQSKIASRILDEEGNIPAIIFVSGRNIDNEDPSNSLIVDLLLHWTYLAPDGIYCGNGWEFKMTPNNRIQIWQNYIWPNFTKDDTSMGRSFLMQLDKLYPISKVLADCSSEYLELRLTGITSNDIERLQNKGWLIGWHSQEHFPLSKLSHELKKQEIIDAPAFMRNVAFSFPYGEHFSVDNDSIKIVGDFGYPCAVSNQLNSSIVSKYFIPRFMLDSNKYLLHFELSGLKYFLRMKKLLPRYNKIFKDN